MKKILMLTYLLLLLDSSQGAVLLITKDFCEKMLVPGPNYLPGIDADGNPVVPAEGDVANILGDKITIPVLVRPNKTQTAGTLDITNDPIISQNSRTVPLKNSDQYTGDIPLGDVEWDLKTGQMTLNDTPLDPSQKTEIQRACDQLKGQSHE